jgi:hypothetical protein
MPRLIRQSARAQADFERLLRKDWKTWNGLMSPLPGSPVHSTDPFQTLEARHGHARLALVKILETRHRFSTVTVLTKNPLGAATTGCLELFKALTILPEGHSAPRRVLCDRHAPFARGEPGLLAAEPASCMIRALPRLKNAGKESGACALPASRGSSH